MAVGQNQWYHFGVGALPILVYSSGDWDVHWGYGILTHGHVAEMLALYPQTPGVFRPVEGALGLPGVPCLFVRDALLLVSNQCSLRLPPFYQ